MSRFSPWRTKTPQAGRSWYNRIVDNYQLRSAARDVVSLEVAGRGGDARPARRCSSFVLHGASGARPLRRRDGG